jgi:hypothetical protein
MMTERDFVYWLQGFFEMANPTTLTPEQVKMIKDHLGYVFEHKQPAPAVAITPTVELTGPAKDYTKFLDQFRLGTGISVGGTGGTTIC